MGCTSGTSILQASNRNYPKTAIRPLAADDYRMKDWQHELKGIVQSSSLIPSFEEWLDATGYRAYACAIYAGNVNLQATAMRSLYDYYQTEMRARFPS
jgi:hypothetical protein